MEALYAKLYEKYNNLKKKKFSELDEINKDQEEKFLNCVSAAEELIQHLRDENDKLRAQADELRMEVFSIRSSKNEQCAEYQKLLVEEKQKNKMLHEEVERLQKQGLLSSKHGKDSNVLETPQVVSGKVYNGSERRMTRSRSRETQPETEEATTTHDYTDRDKRVKRKRRRGTQDEVEEAAIIHSPVNQNGSNHECCERTPDGYGGVHLSDCGHTNCQFQALVEYLVGMKFSTINQIGGICISALHQSSGYSFSLTWMKKPNEGEPDLLYRVSTLGTFELVAPEWMRSVLMFSMSMCPIFFERVANVIKLHR